MLAGAEFVGFDDWSELVLVEGLSEPPPEELALAPEGALVKAPLEPARESVL